MSLDNHLNKKIESLTEELREVKYHRVSLLRKTRNQEKKIKELEALVKDLNDRNNRFRSGENRISTVFCMNLKS